MNYIEKAKKWYQKYKAARDYVDAISALPPNYTIGANQDLNNLFLIQ